LAYGIGLGVEAPIVDDRPFHLDEPLVAGMVLVVQGYVWEPGVGGIFAADTVHLTDNRSGTAHEALSRAFGREPTDWT